MINYVLWFFKRNHFPQQLCCEVKNMLPLSPSIILPDYHQIPENHRTVILPLEVKWLMSKLHYSPCQCHPEYQISMPLHYTHPLPSENALFFTERDIFHLDREPLSFVVDTSIDILSSTTILFLLSYTWAPTTCNVNEDLSAWTHWVRTTSISSFTAHAELLAGR